MEDGVQPFKCIRIAEDQRAELPPVNRTVGRDNAASERLDDFGDGGAAGAFKDVGDVIRVENLAAMPLQHARDRAFATGDSACNRYPHGPHAKAPETAQGF